MRSLLGAQRAPTARDFQRPIKPWPPVDDALFMAPPEGDNRVYEIEVTSLDVEGVSMVTLTVGNLNHFTIRTVDPELREVIQLKAKESYQDLILDISQVQIIDSAGVSGLVALNGFAIKNSLTLHLCGADPKVARILRMMQIHRVLPFHVSKEAALKACISSKVD